MITNYRIDGSSDWGFTRDFRFEDIKILCIQLWSHDGVPVAVLTLEGKNPPGVPWEKKDVRHQNKTRVTLGSPSNKSEGRTEIM